MLESWNTIHVNMRVKRVKNSPETLRDWGIITRLPKNCSSIEVTWFDGKKTLETFQTILPTRDNFFRLYTHKIKDKKSCELCGKPTHFTVEIIQNAPIQRICRVCQRDVLLWYVYNPETPPILRAVFMARKISIRRGLISIIKTKKKLVQRGKRFGCSQSCLTKSKIRYAKTEK